MLESDNDYYYTFTKGLHLSLFLSHKSEARFQFTVTFCYIRQLDWRPERRAGPSRMRHERVVIIKNMFHPMDFEVGNVVLASKSSGMFSYKRVQSLPCPIFVKAYSCSNG